jgi:hypothetical protein
VNPPDTTGALPPDLCKAPGIAAPFAQSFAAEVLTRIRLSWNGELTRLRAIAFDGANEVLGEMVIDVPAETRRQLWTRGVAAQFRLEELAERHLRAMLELRH